MEAETRCQVLLKCNNKFNTLNPSYKYIPASKRSRLHLPGMDIYNSVPLRSRDRPTLTPVMGGMLLHGPDSIDGLFLGIQLYRSIKDGSLSPSTCFIQYESDYSLRRSVKLIRVVTSFLAGGSVVKQYASIKIQDRRIKIQTKV